MLLPLCRRNDKADGTHAALVVDEAAREEESNENEKQRERESEISIRRLQRCCRRLICVAPQTQYFRSAS